MDNLSTATKVHRQIESSEDCYWRVSDFSNYPSSAVCKTLSRLTKSGVIERISKGIYYRPRKTMFGVSRPSRTEIRELPIKQVFHPAGVSAANLLGFTTQNSIHGEFATAANSIPSKIVNTPVRIHTRRPPTWDKISSMDAALLDFLRSRGHLSELSPEETKKCLLAYMKEGDCFNRLLAVALAEPPRVRAMLGAIGQELRKRHKILKGLRDSLNPLSKFDFGILDNLKYAKEWQAK
jgi:hypothetical protein